VTDEEAWNDEPGTTLEGIWTSSDGYTEYNTVDQGFFEGNYVSMDKTIVGKIYGHTFDGSNYYGWYQEYDLTNTSYFDWGNVVNYVHADGTQEEFWYSQLNAISGHYWDGVFLGSNTASKISDSVDFDTVTGDNNPYEYALAAYYEAMVDCDCPECEENKVGTQININFAGLIPANN
jgi:hypothetical protein